jgi:hypothetical protein
MSEWHDKVLHELMTSQFNEAYYRARADRLASCDAWARGAVAILTASAIVSWAGDWTGFWALAWKILSVVAAAVAALAPILQFAERSRQLSDLAARWTSVVGDLRMLDEMPGSSPELIKEQFGRILAKAEQLQAADSDPRHERLAKRIQEAIERQFADRLEPHTAS